MCWRISTAPTSASPSCRCSGDLGFTDDVIGFGAGIFFLGYLLLDIPGSLIVERWSARKWIARIMVSWGLVAALMGFLGTPLFGAFRPVTQFYGMRLLLGIAEAGFFPGVIVYLSHWYRQEDRAARQGVFHGRAAARRCARHARFALDSGEHPLGRPCRLALGLHSGRTACRC